MEPFVKLNALKRIKSTPNGKALLAMNNSKRSIPSFDASESESKVIGALLQDPHRIVSKNEVTGLTPAHFGSEIHKKAWLFLSERAEAGESISPDILKDECPEKLQELNGVITGEAQIVQWFTCSWNLNFEEHAKVVLDMSARRKTYEGVAKAQEAICTGNDLSEVSETLRESAIVADSVLVGCQWEIADAADYWTDDPREIESLSDAPIIEGLIREREVAQLVGPAKSQKTWFAMHAACAIAGGKDFIGRRTAKKRVLYIDYELKRSTLKKRLSMVSRERPDGLDILSLRGRDKLPTVSHIIGMIKRKGYGFIVVDSLYCTECLSEENNNDSVPKELKKLHRITSEASASLLIVDHTAKGGGKDRSAVDSSRGASAKGGFFDSVLALRPQERCSDGGNRVILDMALRDFPSPSSLPVLSYSFTASSCDMDVAGEAEKDDLNGTRQRIFESLHDFEEGATIADVTKKSGIPESTVRRTVNELVGEGKAVEFPDPTHKQRKKFRVPDMADNSDKSSETPSKR